VTIWPVKVNLTFTTSPAGLTLYLDGIAKSTPFVADTVPGFVHTIDARDQSAGSTTYRFASWSDGGAQLHNLVVPTSAQSYSATFTAQVVSTPPAFVQVNSATPQTNQSAVTVRYLAAQAAGDTNVVAIGWNSVTGSVVSVADSAGNTYQQAAPLATGSGLSQTIWYAKNIVASAANTNTVTVTFSAALPYVDLRAAEYRGLDALNPVDVTASASGSSATASSAAVTTTFANALLFGAGMTQGAFTAATGGATTRIITPQDADIAQDRIVSATGSYSATASLGASPWLMQMVAFRAGSATPDTTPPSQPTGLTATAVSGSQINLSWTASTDNLGVTGYRVFRNTVLVGTSATTTYSDTGHEAATAYSYTVSAVDAAGNISTASAPASATTAAPDTSPPSQPTGLTATAVSGSQINLSWTASTDNVGVTGYRVFRNAVQVASPTTTTYNDTGLASSTTYTYTVSAVDAAGNNSATSAAATATTPQVTTPPAFVQVIAATPQTNQSVVTARYVAAQTAGNINVVAIGWNAATGSVVSVTDSAGNAYQQAAPVATGNALSQTLWYAKNIVASAANTNTVTVTFSAALPYVDVRASEYRGIDKVNPVDVTASASGSTLAASSGPVTTTFANALIFGAGMTQGSFAAATGGATTRSITTPDADITQDAVVSATGTYAATANQTSASPWVMQVVAFRAG
jgi:chitodextrinase